MSTSHQAGPAAPTPAAAELPKYKLHGTGGKLAFLELDCSEEHQVVSVMCRSHGPVSFHHCLSPQQARELAVALVDCANALDNPAQRVIVDEPEHRHCDGCKHRADAQHACDGLTITPRSGCTSWEGEGIGHE